MSLFEIFKIINRDGIGWIVVVYILLQLVEVSKIQINPISAITEWIGNRLNKNLCGKIDEISENVACLETELNAHIEREKVFNRESARREILDFELELRNGSNPSVEHFQRVIGVIDWYSNDCHTNNIKNGVVDSASTHIKNEFQRVLESEVRYE